MSGSKARRVLPSAVLLGASLLGMTAVSSTALAQPAGNPNEICGDGTTFTVQLPGTTLGIDDSDGLFRSIDVPAVARPDSVTLPNGCRIYAIFISGYGNNRHYDDIPFFKVAEFVAKHDGYVHTGWWNNFTKEYAAGPLHPENIVIQRTILGIPVGDPETIGPTPSTDGDLLAFAPLLAAVDRPKANPDDDFQFQSDAALVIQAIRANNPNAIIVVAGHSMGGNAVVRLGMNPNVPIDLLAPIDPVGNRDKPRGIPGQRNFNWTRWRVANGFRGYKQWDCVRTGGVLNTCRDFDSRIFYTSFQCAPVGPWLDVRPVITSRAPIACPYVRPYIDGGTRLGFGANIQNLYHRWQHEFIWPVDFPFDERLNFPQPRSSSILWPNYQEPVLQQLNPFLPNEPDKTCLAGTDPRDASWACNATDGHGEIIGHRGPKGESRPALQMQQWPGRDQPAERRAKMIELATADAFWPHRPQNPNLCLVCDDMIAIVQHLLAQQPQPPADEDESAPVSVASANPGPGPAGWNNEDVIVTVKAADEMDGSGVEEIEIALSGAQSGLTLTPGSVAEATVTAEGQTTITFFARDNAGNAESAQMLNVLIDKTPPTVAAATGVEPNVNGWFRTPVLVSFPAADEMGGSGLASTTADVAVPTEGVGQETGGTAEDNAGNTASAAVTLNIDLTPPGIALASRTPAANAAGWNRTDVSFTWNCTDALSGPVSPTDSMVLTAEGAAQMASGSCTDRADNVVGDTQTGVNIDKTNPAITITTPPDGAIYVLNAPVNSAFGCTDSLSGVDSCTGTVVNGAPVDASSVGDKAFTVSSDDVADNQSSVTHHYAVQYVFSGFGSPVGPMPMVNVMKAGRTVPVKYSLRDANGAFISNLASFESLMSWPAACDAGSPSGMIEDADSAGNTAIRYDAAANQFIFNWKTDASWAGTCRALTLTLNDRTEHLAMFRFQ